MKLKSHVIDRSSTIIAHRTISASNFRKLVLPFSSEENSPCRSSYKTEVENRWDSIEIERSRKVIALSLSLSGHPCILLRVHARLCVCRARSTQLRPCVLLRPPTSSLKYIYLARPGPYLSTNTRIRPNTLLIRCNAPSHRRIHTGARRWPLTYLNAAQRLRSVPLESHRPSDSYDLSNVFSRTGNTPFQWQYRYNPRECDFKTFIRTDIRSNVIIQQRYTYIIVFERTLIKLIM